MDESTKTSKQTRIFVMIPPASGHINPVTGLVHELCKRPNVEVVFYSHEQYRSLVEKTGAQYRAYDGFDPSAILCKPLHETTEPSVVSLSSQLIDVSHRLLPQLIRDFLADKPDLIIYDPISLPTKYLLEYLRVKKLDGHLKTVNFIPWFAMNTDITSDLLLLGSWKNRLWILLRTLYLACKQIRLSWRFGLKIVNPLGLIFRYRDDIKICSVFPELQPAVERFDKSFHFVGSCIIEDVRSFGGFEPRLKSIIDLIDSNADSKLIYVSMGTVFNNNVFVYDIIISAFERLALQDDTTSSTLQVVISLGDANYALYERKMSNDPTYRLPGNVHLFARVPQLELLKRAALFISHAGMNSASEAIQYAVPMVCIPLQADQPIVAKRCCQELQLGVHLNALALTPHDVIRATLDVLGNRDYKENMLKMAEISKRYNGSLNASNLVMTYLSAKRSN